jgi:hypothetical protein
MVVDMTVGLLAVVEASAIWRRQKKSSVDNHGWQIVAL